ncbi:nuclear transport factor 2 family protein [Jejuia pallidilutea]|uniref:SnoaL-like domain-containing protein n=2 Tax=Jejuia pallidilutea TaxID=504487 RepID=A0A090VUY2_9FLAO|nr:nuclear transport factor 2 family protein [Jejuia pallidilutea]GAL68521.1 hypothetical protein JCM19301_1919 [Jejuia pallidilutea]GAL88401.1 hypothetical protein JCM19538_2914 [Jejuia pallidilutea]
MKKLVLLSFAALLIMACQQKDTRYTQNSSEIDVVKKHIENYNTKNYDTSIMADTCKSYFNTKNKPILRKDIIAYHKANDANYTKRGFLSEDQEFEMVVTDNGETWVNAWLDWRATLKESGKVVDMPIHLTYRFIDGKIVREVGFWDPTEIVLALQEIEAQRNITVE